jgi:hypothetical protein
MSYSVLSTQFHIDIIFEVLTSSCFDARLTRHAPSLTFRPDELQGLLENGASRRPFRDR